MHDLNRAEGHQLSTVELIRIIVDFQA